VTGARLLIGLAALACACSAGSAPPAGEVLQVMEDFTMSQTAEGQHLWQLKARKADISLDGAARITEPELLFYRKGVHASTARARKGTVQTGSNDVALEEDVVIVAHAEKTTLHTTRLDYSTKDRRFRTNEEVLIVRPDARIKGKGMEADEALTDITLYKQETVLK